jgi:hypothetical protein
MLCLKDYRDDWQKGNETEALERRRNKNPPTPSQGYHGKQQPQRKKEPSTNENQVSKFLKHPK